MLKKQQRLLIYECLEHTIDTQISVVCLKNIEYY